MDDAVHKDAVVGENAVRMQSKHELFIPGHVGGLKRWIKVKLRGVPAFVHHHRRRRNGGDTAMSERLSGFKQACISLRHEKGSVP